MSLKNKISDLKDLWVEKLNWLNNSHTMEYSQEFEYGSAQSFDLRYEAMAIDRVKVQGVELSESQFKHTYKKIEILDPLEAGDYVQVDYKLSLVNTEVYGIIIDQSTAAPEVERVGNMALHASLPIQSGMKRCVVNDDASVNYYLHANDSILKEDTSAANIDGTDGQVMVEIPIHWRRFTCLSLANSIWQADFSLKPFPGAHEVKSQYRDAPVYVGAYKSAIHRPTNKLSSVCNTTADYRGGNNQSAWDAENQFKSQLGKPVTNRDRGQFHTYAQNRGEVWNESDFYVRSAVSWLITLEYATTHHQQAMDGTLTTEGYKKGGLGTGATNLSGADWSTFNDRYPIFRCGLTNSLGNATGEIPVVVQDFPSTGQSVNTQVFSYRGVENFFGDLWEWTNGVNFDHTNNIAYVRVDTEVSSSSYDGYRPVPIAASNGYISKMAIGAHGDLLPQETAGASSSTYWADYFWQNPGALRGLLASGAVANGSLAGSFVSYSNNAPSYAIPTFGSRLFLI